MAYCTACGNQMEHRAAFCTKCGNASAAARSVPDSWNRSHSVKNGGLKTFCAITIGVGIFIGIIYAFNGPPRDFYEDLLLPPTWATICSLPVFVAAKIIYKLSRALWATFTASAAR